MRQPAQALSPQVTTLSGYNNRSSLPTTTGTSIYVSSHENPIPLISICLQAAWVHKYVVFFYESRI